MGYDELKDTIKSTLIEALTPDEQKLNARYKKNLDRIVSRIIYYLEKENIERIVKSMKDKGKPRMNLSDEEYKVIFPNAGVVKNDLEDGIKYDSDYPPEAEVLVEEGLRYDEGKSRLDLLDPDFILALGELAEFGSKKYSERNWEKGMRWGKVISSLGRHFLEIMKGNDYDEETKKPHAVHIGINAMMLYNYLIHKKGTDDRPSGNKTETN